MSWCVCVCVYFQARRPPPAHLVSWAELVNGEHLGGVERFAEHVYGAQLTTEDPVGVGRL